MVLEWLLLLEKDENILDNIYGDILLNDSVKKRENLKNMNRFWFCSQKYLWMQIVWEWHHYMYTRKTPYCLYMTYLFVYIQFGSTGHLYGLEIDRNAK